MVISSRKELEEAIMSNNSKRFTLAHESPLIQEEYKQHFGAVGDTTLYSNLLKGMADISHFPEEIQAMLQLFSPTSTISTLYIIKFQQ